MPNKSDGTYYSSQPFRKIAPHYRLANTIFSGGLDKHWRRCAIKALDLNSPPGRILDIGCGGGEMLELVPSKGGWIKVGVDPELMMMSQARHFFYQVQGVGEELPFSDSSFDRVTSAWTLRNLSSRISTFSEIARVLKKGCIGTLLDFSPPNPSVFSLPLTIYLRRIIPLLGRFLFRDKFSYEYLSSSILAFVSPEVIVEELKLAGLDKIRWWRLLGGLAVLYRFEK